MRRETNAHEDRSINQKAIITREAKDKIMGVSFRESGRKGQVDKGIRSQVVAAPLRIAPKPKFKVGKIKGVPFSNLKLAAGWLERNKRQKDEIRTE